MTTYRRQGVLPGLVAGLTFIARDEHRHVAFGARFLRDMARRDPRYREAAHRTLAAAVPIAERALLPPGRGGLHGADESAAGSATRALSRRLKAIGLA